MQFRFNHPIMVLAFEDNHQLAVSIPVGQIVEVIGAAENDDRFLVLSVNDEPFHAFASDLADGAEQVSAA
jgi:hypothetical protein